MSQSKEERKAYLRGKVAALETLEKFWSAGNGIDGLTLSWQLNDARRAIAALDIPQLAEQYGADRVEIEAPWEWDDTFSAPTHGRPVLGSDHEVHTDLTYADEQRLGLRKRKPKRVWFEAECWPRQPALGEWFWFEFTHEWVQAQRDYKYDQFICAIRHEEYDDAPQIVTQADVDRVIGGAK